MDPTIVIQLRNVFSGTYNIMHVVTYNIEMSSPILTI